MKDSDEMINQIKEDLISLGVRSGGCLLVHSSMRSLGQVAGGPETVIQGLLSSLGPKGTLLLPALSYLTVNAVNPVFDVRNTPSCVGLISEYFRTRPGTCRSINPTHSISAYGAKAQELTCDHWKDSTPVGLNSPLRKLVNEKGQILMLGCGLRPNTSMHGIEELSVPPYLFSVNLQYKIILADGREESTICRRHGFKGWEQRYDRVKDIMTNNSLREGPVLEAHSYLIEAADLWEKAHERLLSDPLYFVDKITWGEK